MRSRQRTAQLAQLGFEARARDDHLAGLRHEAVEQVGADAHGLARDGAQRRQGGRRRQCHGCARHGSRLRARHPPSPRAVPASRPACGCAAASGAAAGSAAWATSRARLHMGRTRRPHAGRRMRPAWRRNRSTGARYRATSTLLLPSDSISDSMRWARSPRRIAPASRALPLSVCSVRSIEARGAPSFGS